MSKYLVDIINFNADASCFPNDDWIKSLRGGKKSEFYSYLKNYINYKKKISIGITGGTLTDIVNFNPESIDLLNQHPDIFEIIVRPYAHDIAHLRSTIGFKLNLELGIAITTKYLKQLTFCYLPPEFMLTNAQLNLINDYNFSSVLINPGRFNKEVQEQLPNVPYRIEGLFGHTTLCYPFHSCLTNLYLKSLQLFNTDDWNSYIENQQQDILYSWRDGESPFLIPNGIKREENWLKNESKQFKRVFIKEIETSNDSFNSEKALRYKNYPVHSFQSWMKEMRMLGFIEKVHDIELELPQLNKLSKILWLLLINSDILSSVEKNSPRVKLQSFDTNDIDEYIIKRTTRLIEGEQLLHIFENQDLNFLTQYSGRHDIADRLIHRINFLLEANFTNVNLWES